MLGLLIACTGDTEEGFVSADVQVDGAPKGEVWSTDPQLCVSGGEVLVAWSDERDRGKGIWVNRSENGGERWLADVQRADEGMATAQSPSVACQPGAAVVAWEDNRDGSLDVPNIYARSTMSGGTSWLAASSRLGDDEWGWFESRAARTVASGRNVYVVWQDARYGSYDILFAASYDFGATWSPAVRLDWSAAGESWSGNPSIASDADGHVYAVWEDRRNGETDIYVTSSADAGVTWSDDFRVDTGDEKGAFGSYDPRVVAAGAEAWVVWVDERGGEFHDLYANRTVDGGATWLEPSLRVDSDLAGASESVAPSVALVGGTLHVAWQEERVLGYDIYYRQAIGGAWSGLERQLDNYQGEASHSFSPRLVASGTDVVVGFMDERYDLDGGSTDLFYNWSSDGGATWPDRDFRLNSLEGGEAASVDLQLAIDETHVFAVWADDRTGTDDIWFTSLPLGEASSNPDDTE